MNMKGFRIRNLHRLRCTRGQALVEFALVVPMLLIMIIGMVEFGRAWMNYQVLTDAAREGARNAVIYDVDITEEDIFSAIRARLAAAGIDVSGAVEETEPTCDGDGAAGPAAQVEVRGCNWGGTRGTPAGVAIRAPFTFRFLGPLIGWATGDRTITLSTSFVMRNE